jgi:LacI family transcriptional regulator
MSSRTGKSKVTLAAVARDAGVALSTASIILSRNATYLRNFSEATMVRVRESAKKLGYQPSLIASGLPSKGSSVFFLVSLNDLQRELDASRFQWGFDGDLLGGITEASQEARVYPILALAHTHSAEFDGENLDRVIKGGVFGAIVRSPSALVETQIRQYIRDSRPVVVVFPNRIAEWPSSAVDVDNLDMGYRAGNLLARKNRKRWVIIVDEHRDSHALRLRGFQAAARKARAAIQILKCDPDLDVPQTSPLLFKALSFYRPDGVFALTSRTAEGALQACEHADLRPGVDTLLIGCDCSVWNRPLLPRITSLEVSWRDAGHHALQMLLKMRNQGKSRHPRLLLKSILVPGDTCPSEQDDT